MKLIALDAEDLAIVSTHLQDAVLRPCDLAFLPHQHRFAFVASRCDWEAGGEPRRLLTGFHFDRVLGCRTRGIDRTHGESVLHLLGITFEETEAPSGIATLIFAEGAIQLDLECIDAHLRDLGPARAESKASEAAIEGQS